MSYVHVNSERVVDARPDEVYDILTDYAGKRQHLLTPNFLDYTVEQGGHGEGTVVHYRLHAAGRERPYRINVKEAERGRVITEQDTNSSLVTTWTLFPLQGGQQTRVQIASQWEGASGIGGFFERTFAPLGLRRVYADMLSLLSRQVQPTSESTIQEEQEARKAAVIRPLVLLGVAVAVVATVNVLRRGRKQEAH